jgi:hypothetical protein
LTLPDAPVFFAQHTSRGRAHDRLSAVAEARSKQSKALPGLLLDFGAVHLRGVEEDKTRAGKLAPILPSGSAYEIASKWKVPMAPWVQRAAPSTKAQWNATVKESLKKQRELDVDALVVPGAELEAGDYPKGLEDQVDAIRRAWVERPDDDPPWFAEFCLHDDWIKNQNACRLVLNLLTDLPDAIGIALRIRFAKRDAAGDASVLGRLRLVVGALADDGRKVLLIQSGIVGWLSIAWGAWGFSAGMSQESWLYHRTVIRRRSGQPSPPRVERYFERQLLHPVLSADHGRLSSATGYTQCGCAFCGALAEGGAWDHNASAQHSLYALASLTEAAGGVDRAARRDAVRATIESAQNLWAQWKGTSGLSGQATPAGLPIWRSLV